MLLTLTLSRKSSLLAANYFPAIDLSDGDYEFVLMLVRNPVTESEIELFKVQWRMPHVALNKINKLSMLRTLESSRYLSMSFRSWDLYEFPLLQNTTKHSWAVKTATQLEKPRYVIFALQTGRKNVVSPDLNLDFGKKRYAVLFDMYARFRRAYYGNDCFETLLNVLSFTEEGPFVIIDCSRQNESVKGVTVDVRIEFDCKENVPANTTAYGLIIHDRVVHYSQLIPTLCVKSPKCILRHAIKYRIHRNRSQSRKIVRHDRTNVCGSASIYHWKAIYREGIVEKRSHSLSLHFYVSYAMEFLDKIRKVLRFLAECLSPWIAMGRRDDPVHHGETPDYNGCNWCGRE
ncbi:hypothetical protein ALC57_11433 [Trachymyrmex cornetzi]|uniref:Double jelly roll-like domain-containing protein n=1 Tax=Trachymyrmex cornetzi TaxID=471704 RepID=A0A151J2K7_9HYME|nr:hypothetical protein ALC57_11433 [Trachymyrmex cornetzi]